MSAMLAWCRMVRKYGNSYWLIPILYSLIYRTYRTFIKILYCLKLQFQVAFMSCLVTCLNMQINEIIRFQSFDCSCCLSFIICIIKSCSTFHIYTSQSGITSDTTDKIYSCYHRAFLYLRIFLRQRFHLRSVSGTPWPYTVCRVLAFSHTFQIYRMRCQKFLRFKNKCIQQIGSFLSLRTFSLNHIRAERLQRNIMRRNTAKMLVTAFYYQQMTVLNTCIEMYPVSTKSFFKEFNQFVSLFSRDMSCRMIFKSFTFNTYDIATHSHISRLKVNTDACSFKHSASFIHRRQVISHYRHVCNLTAGMKPVGYCLQHTGTSHSSKLIHIWSLCILQ